MIYAVLAFVALAAISSATTVAPKPLVPAVHRPKVFSPPAAQNLRRAEPKVDLEQYVRVSGYFENVKYHTPATCEDPLLKQVEHLNTCGKAANSTTLDTLYMEVQAYSNTLEHFYDTFFQYYTSSNCASGTQKGDPVYHASYPILICDVQTGTLQHVISEPLSVEGDNLGFTLLTYQNQSACQTNNEYDGALEFFYGRLGLCYPTADEGGMFIVESCTDEQLVLVSFPDSSTSCDWGAPYQYYYLSAANSTVCNTGDFTINGIMDGWQNYGCSTAAR